MSLVGEVVEGVPGTDGAVVSTVKESLLSDPPAVVLPKESVALT